MRKMITTLCALAMLAMAVMATVQAQYACPEVCPGFVCSECGENYVCDWECGYVCEGLDYRHRSGNEIWLGNDPSFVIISDGGIGTDGGQDVILWTPEKDTMTIEQAVTAIGSNAPGWLKNGNYDFRSYISDDEVFTGPGPNPNSYWVADGYLYKNVDTISGALWMGCFHICSHSCTHQCSTDDPVAHGAYGGFDKVFIDSAFNGIENTEFTFAIYLANDYEENGATAYCFGKFTSDKGAVNFHIHDSVANMNEPTETWMNQDADCPIDTLEGYTFIIVETSTSLKWNDVTGGITFTVIDPFVNDDGEEVGVVCFDDNCEDYCDHGYANEAVVTQDLYMIVHIDVSAGTTTLFAGDGTPIPGNGWTGYYVSLKGISLTNPKEFTIMGNKSVPYGKAIVSLVQDDQGKFGLTLELQLQNGASLKVGNEVVKAIVFTGDFIAGNKANDTKNPVFNQGNYWDKFSNVAAAGVMKLRDPSGYGNGNNSQITANINQWFTNYFATYFSAL